MTSIVYKVNAKMLINTFLFFRYYPFFLLLPLFSLKILYYVFPQQLPRKLRDYVASCSGIENLWRLLLSLSWVS